METTTLVKENADSVEVSQSTTGKMGWTVKVYGDSQTEAGIGEMEKRIAALKKLAIDASK